MQLFLMTLGYLRSLYVKLAANAQMEALLDCHIHAFEYFQGVPHEILYDNMGSKVKSLRGRQRFYHYFWRTTLTCPSLGNMEFEEQFATNAGMKKFGLKNVRCGNEKIYNYNYIYYFTCVLFFDFILLLAFKIYDLSYE